MAVENKYNSAFYIVFVFILGNLRLLDYIDFDMSYKIKP